MDLATKEIDGLMRLIGLTKEQEIDCGQCHAVIAEFAEQQLTGRSIPDGLKVVEDHLSIYAACREEYGYCRRQCGPWTTIDANIQKYSR
jgi:hypothetical protein